MRNHGADFSADIFVTGDNGASHLHCQRTADAKTNELLAKNSQEISKKTDIIN